MDRCADVPAHLENNRSADDFALTNKSLLCCYVCRLVKSRNQASH
jgi:transcription elongation factor SPT4